uniref:tRNA-splicing endonuclease subunit Sen54 N-terminal domain-containing protein n=1 Tax=Aegilops tauschii TaxID=37682 RepID=R7W9W8_AEGTA
MTPKERNQLYGDLAKLAKLSESHVLPAHILELLKKHSRRGLCGDYIEIEMHAVQDAALVEMQKQLDKFLRERANPTTHHQHKKMMAQDQEEDEDVDIVGGVSPLPVRPTPVQLVEEDGVYVDICGDASPSPVKNLGQGATISGSSGSDSDSSHQSVDSRPAPAERAANTTPPTRDLIARANEILERRRKEATSRAREKARQQVLEMERTAMPKDTLDEDVKALGIDQHNTARPNNLLRQMGLFLKVDDHDLKQQHQCCQEDLEEGEIRNMASLARWVEEGGAAEVLDNKVKLWQAVVQCRGDRYFNLQSEACWVIKLCRFLVERGALVLLNDKDVTIAMEEIYGKIAGGSYGCSRLAFQAYKHLKLLGYIVGRYGVPWTMICVKPYVAEQNYHRRYRSR